MKPTYKKIAGVICLVFFLVPSGFIHAATTEVNQLKQDSNQLNQDLQSKKDRLKEVEGLIGNYSERIKKQEQQKVTLENTVVLLDNQAQQKELTIEEIKTQIDIANLEIKKLDASIKAKSDKMTAEKSMISDLITRIQQTDQTNMLQVFLSKPTLSSYFDRLEEIKQLESDLNQNLQRVTQEKADSESDRKARDEKRQNLIDQNKQLTNEQDQLQQQKNAKLSLLAETKDKQTEFNRALDELHQQQESTADEIGNIQSTLKDKLDAIDEALAKGSSLLLYPVPLRKITVKFHDPNYPFRYLFEHPGIDLRASVGTPIHAAAGGYVAWNKVGKMYGNYVMIIHPGNLATVYGHLSKFAAKPNTYVERGDIIGYTGGMPGMPGAGLSTGPHLHFEVRQDGIPVDPMGFLPEAVETDP